MSKWTILSFILLAALVVVTPLKGQARANISGQVRDNTGHLIAGVNVTVTKIASRLELPTVTNDRGSYRVDYLEPGTYQMTASLPGFKTVRRRLFLATGDSLHIDFTLEIGRVTEEVRVKAETPLLESGNATLTSLIQNEQIETLPLAQGNPAHLLTMAPGSSSAPGGGWNWDDPGRPVTTGFYFHGSQGNAVGFTLNGINNSGTILGGSQQPQVQPSAEAVQEIKVAHDYTAVRGHHNGTTVDFTLKSGSNDWHGSLYGFFRESAWGANDFFSNRAGADKLPVKYRRVGGGVNGPIIPDKTFFSFTYEDTFQRRLEFYGVRTLPTSAMKSGNFSALLALGPEYQIYDPETTTPTGDGFFARQPFPNNIIPSNRIDPISTQLMSFYPEPNLAGGPDGTRNFQPTTATPAEWVQWFTRLDHSFGPGNRIFGSFAKLENWAVEWRDYYATAATGLYEGIDRETFGLDDVWTLNPTLLLNFRVSYNRATNPRAHKSHRLHPRGEFFDIFSLPLSGALKAQLDPDQSALPHVQISDFSGIHDETQNRFNAATHLTGQVYVDINRGNHNLKLGFESRANHLSQKDQRWSMPVYRFGCDFSKGPLNTSPCAQGQGFAAFLLGQPTGGFINRNDSYAVHHNYYGTFIQDNWRVVSRLTLNLGLRWEYFAPVTERFNRSVRGFDFAAPSPIAAAAQTAYSLNPIPEIPADQFRVNGGIQYAGVGGSPRELYDAPTNLFAPRGGFAYRFSEDTVLRAGYGLFHQPIGILGNSLNPILTGFSQRTDLVPSFDNGVTFVADFVNPFPDGILSPVGNANGLSTNLGQSVSFFNQNDLRVPFNQRWSATIQHMLPGNTLLEIGYVGTKGTRILGRRDLNALPGVYLSSSSTRNQANADFLGQQFPNPFAGLLPGTGLNTSTISRSQLLKPYPHFTGVTLQQTNQGYSSYHGLETRLEKRLSNGHAFMIGYTYSRFNEATQFLNASDPLPFEVIATADRPHNFKLSGIYEFPWGRRHPAGGWQISSVWQLQSGFPMDFRSHYFTTSGFSPDNLSISNPTVDRWFNTDAGFVRDRSLAPERTHKRTQPLRFAELRSDIVNFWDISIIKDTYIYENHQIRFQAQFLNAFNRPNFGAAVTNPTSGSFGVVTSETAGPRRIMFAIKWMF